MAWRRKNKISLRKNLAGNIIRNAIEGIQREGDDPYDEESPFIVNAFLHKINLSTDWNHYFGAYEKLKAEFGNFYMDKDYKPHGRMPNYGKRMIKSMQDFDIYFYYEPRKNVARNYIEIIPKEKTSLQQYRAFLHSLNELLGVVNVSSVEYAIDLYCHDRESIQRLFRMLKRHIHVPYSRGAFSYGEEIDLGNDVQMNSIFRIGDMKGYERGDDEKKAKGCWSIDDCDRVRLELSVYRGTFRECKIKTVSDLLESAQFQKINEGIYKFKWFEGSRKLPHCCDAYRASDAQGNKNCLQYEINYFRNKVKNLNQYLKDVEAFEPFKQVLLEAMIKFDTVWQN